MRLTHFVKLDQEERDSLQASICPAADAVGDASIRISQDVPGGAAAIVWLTIAEHDVITDLVRAHRPVIAVNEEAPGKCAGRMENILECALNDNHVNPIDEHSGPNPVGGYHVNEQGILFAVPAVCDHNWVPAEDGDGHQAGYLHCGKCGAPQLPAF